MELFTSQKKEWSIQEMVEALGYHKSSIHRIVSTLEGEGFLERIYSIARPIMVQLVERVKETSYLCIRLCIRDGNQCLYVEKYIMFLSWYVVKVGYVEARKGLFNHSWIW